MHWNILSMNLPKSHNKKKKKKREGDYICSPQAPHKFKHKRSLEISKDIFFNHTTKFMYLTSYTLNYYLEENFVYFSNCTCRYTRNWKNNLNKLGADELRIEI